MKLAQHVTYNACRFGVLNAGLQPHFVHHMQNAPLHRLLTVFDIGNGAPAHHAHGVGQIAALGEGAHIDEVAFSARTTARAGRGCGWHDSRATTLTGGRTYRYGSVGKQIQRIGIRQLGCLGFGRVHTSASTWSPLSSIQVQRRSASFFDISILNSAKVFSLSSIRTCSRRRVSGHSVVSHN